METQIGSLFSAGTHNASLFYAGTCRTALCSPQEHLEQFSVLLRNTQNSSWLSAGNAPFLVLPRNTQKSSLFPIGKMDSSLFSAQFSVPCSVAHPYSAACPRHDRTPGLFNSISRFLIHLLYKEPVPSVSTGTSRSMSVSILTYVQTSWFSKKLCPCHTGGPLCIPPLGGSRSPSPCLKLAAILHVSGEVHLKQIPGD